MCAHGVIPTLQAQWYFWTVLSFSFSSICNGYGHKCLLVDYELMFGFSTNHKLQGSELFKIDILLLVWDDVTLDISWFSSG